MMIIYPKHTEPMKNRLPIGTVPTQWPDSKAGVLEVAKNWYDPSIASINEAVIASLDLPPIKTGAEPGMTAGKMGMDWEDSIALSLALNSINYQFWDLGPQGEFLRYDFEGVVGAQGMRQAFERAWNDPASPLSRARTGKPLDISDIEAMFGNIPSPESRVAVLNEMLLPPSLAELCSKLDEEIADNDGVGVFMAQQIADAFPLSYGDQVLKKAQLALSELWVKLEESSQGGHGCDLTAFADYQIPNILRAMGVLEYSDELAQKIASYQEIPYESVEEKAIRGASLLAVEKIAIKCGVPVAAVDHYLWMRRKEATTPFHLTFTTAY